MKRAALLGLVLPTLAWAHAVGLSLGHYEATRDGLTASLTFTRAELESVATGPLESWVASRIEVPGCTLRSSAATPAERDGVTIEAQWRCA